VFSEAVCQFASPNHVCVFQVPPQSTMHREDEGYSVPIRDLDIEMDELVVVNEWACAKCRSER
jgi:hypothetical protein